MSYQSEIAPNTQQLLRRGTGGQIRFSDVLSEVANLSDEAWWRRTDFDAALTDHVESTGFPEVTQVPIGFRKWMGHYGLVLADDLLRSNNERVNELHPRYSAQAHPDEMRDVEQSNLATLALANYAPRDEKNTAENANGSDFYLAITDAGLEVYATPLDFLDGLDRRHRIISLYQIPTKGHPEFNGDHEQFRSARVVRTRRHPGHLVPKFQYDTREDLIRAKKAGEHPQIIPRDERDGRLAFVDKFGNVKLEINNLPDLQRLQLGKFATLQVEDSGSDHEIGVHLAEDLRSAPLGELAIYANCSDARDHGSNTGFVELAARVDENPSTARNTAMFQLLERVPDLDPATANVRIVK